MKKCFVISGSNEKKSELKLQLQEILGSERLAINEYKRIEGDIFVNEFFGDWKAAYKSQLNNEFESEEGTPGKPIVGRVKANGEPQLFLDRAENLYYYENKDGLRDYLDDRKLKEFTEEDKEEITLILLNEFTFAEKNKDFNNYDKEDLESNGKIIASIDSYVNRYKNLIQNSGKDEDYIADQLFYADLILENKNDFRQNIINRLESFGLKFSETITEVDEAESTDRTERENEEEESLGVTQQIRESYESSAKDSATVNTKIMLSKIPYSEFSTDEAGNTTVVNSPGGLLNTKHYIPFEDVWSTIQPLLSDIVMYNVGNEFFDVISQMKYELKNLSSVKPWAARLIRDMDTMDQNKLGEFIQAFSKTKLNFYVTEVNGNKYKIINATSTTEADSQLIKNWGSSFKGEYLDSNGMLSDDNLLKAKEAKEILDDISDSFDIQDGINGVVENIFDFLYAIEEMGVPIEAYDEDTGELIREGINPSDVNTFLLQNGGDEKAGQEFLRLVNGFRHAIDGVIKKEKTKFIKDNVWYNPFKEESVIKELAKANRVRQNSITDNAILANGGKSYYPYTNPTYITNKLNQWKREIENSPAGQETSLHKLASGKNSYWLNYLLGRDGILRSEEEAKKESIKRIKDFKSGLSSSFKSKGENNGVGNTEIKYGDAINEHITQMLGSRVSNGKSYFPTIAAADKGRRVVFEGLPFFSSGIERYAEGYFEITEKTIDLFQNYFLDEYNRMRRVAREIRDLNDNEKIVHYHTIEKNGLKSQIFPDFSHESNNEKYEELRSYLYDKDGLPLLFNSTHLSDNQIKHLRDAIKENIEERVLDTLSELKNIDNINSEILNSYKKSNDNKDSALTRLAADYFVNGMISSIEYGNMFSGDPAFYKNPSDLIKRIPATYTDGLQLRLSGNRDLVFNMAAVKSVQGESMYIDKILESVNDKDIAKAYEDVNIADAQAWITPSRWRFLKMRLGQWSAFHDSVYEKMMKGQDLKPKEAKIAAQPMKGVYFDINRGRPVYLKYSQAVLIPGLVKGTPMEALYNKMTKDPETGEPYVILKDKKNEIEGKNHSHKEIHEVITTDGIKVGAVSPTMIHDMNQNLLSEEKINLNPVKLDNRGWKLQQDLPTKLIKQTNVGSQIQKNILDNLQLNEMYGDLEGKQLLQEIHDTVSGLSNLGKKELEELLGIVNGKITDKDKIYKQLIKEYTSRNGADENIVGALKKRDALDSIPQIGGKVQSILMSMFNKKLHKISTPGGSFIQVSPFGLQKVDVDESKIRIVSDNYDGKGLQPPRKDPETGKVLRGQAFMPHSEAMKLLSRIKDENGNKIDFSKKSGKELMEYLTPEVLEVITYRIPNQGMSSNDALEIVGILPMGMGDSIIAYDGIPAKTGSDFDIDKMFMMTYNFKVEDGKVVRDDGEPGSKKFLQNKLIDLYNKILTDPKTYDAMMRSIDGDFLKEDIAGTKKNPEKGLFPAPKMGNMELFSPTKQMRIKFEYLSGKTGVGKTAVHLVDHVSNQSLDILMKGYLGVGQKVEIEGKYYTQFDKGTDSDQSIAETLSAFLNAYVDIAKDPYISRGNHNDYTANITFMLIRAGADLKWINRFMGQPILKKLVKRAEEISSITHSGGTAMTDEIALKRAYEYVIKDLKAANSFETESKRVESLSIYGLEKRIKEEEKKSKGEKIEPLESMESIDYDVLKSFMFLMKSSKSFTKSVGASRADTKGGRGSFVDRQIAENKIREVVSDKVMINFMSKFLDTSLGTYHNNSVKWTGEVISSSGMFIAGKKSFQDMLNLMSNKLKGDPFLLSPTFGKKVEKAAMTYISSGSEFLNTTEKEKKDLLTSLGSRIMDKKKFSKNYLIKELIVQSEGKKTFLTIDSNNKPAYYNNKMYNSWLDLYYSDIELDRKLATDLVKYLFISTGFQSKKGSFIANLPHEILRQNGYTSHMSNDNKNESDSIDKDDIFLDQLSRHNADDPSIVKRVSDATKIPGTKNTIAAFQMNPYDSMSMPYVTKIDEHDGETINLYKRIGTIPSVNQDKEGIKNGTAKIRYDDVYLRIEKLGHKGVNGSAVEYSQGVEVKKSIFSENKINSFESERIRKTFEMLKNDKSFIPVNKSHLINTEIKVKNEENVEHSKRVGNTEEINNDVSSISQESEVKEFNTFTYDGKTIETEFVLGEGQRKALEDILDFVLGKKTGVKNDTGYLLEGGAGTGKTTIIGYVDKMLKKLKPNSSILYTSPTHAANVVLAKTTAKLGNTNMPSTIASSVREMINSKTKKKEGIFTFKASKSFKESSFSTIVVDESSMMSNKDFQNLLSAADKEGLKVIFMGDIDQLPDPGSSGKDIMISDVFSKLDKSILDTVYRQKKGPLLSLLEKIKSNSFFRKYKIKSNSNEIQFKKQNEYKAALENDILNNTEDTMVLSAKNSGVASANKMARAVLGYSGAPRVGEIIIGYGGKDNKQLEKGQLANSIRYKIEKVSIIKTPFGSKPVRLELSSKDLDEVKEMGIKLSEESNPSTNYYQLSPSDSFVFDEISEEDMALNNASISQDFRSLHEIQKELNSYPKPERRRMASLLNQKSKIEMLLAFKDLGNDYIYSPTQDKMILFNKNNKAHTNPKHKHLIFKKGADYGYAMTVHKSQGSTIKNVYLELDSIDSFPERDVKSGDRVVNSMKNALYYVGASRASEKLVILDNIEFDEEIDLSEEETAVDFDVENSDLKSRESVDAGVEIYNNSISREEEIEMFEMIKPFLESQGAKTNSGKNAPIMIGMGLRWDYKSNNPNLTPIQINSTIDNSPYQRSKYGYYDKSFDGKPLGVIPSRLKYLISKATGVDATHYDGAIINVYKKGSFISAHADVDESSQAINYPVLVANIGGEGSLSIESSISRREKKSYSNKDFMNKPLGQRASYVFGKDGINRDIYHRTIPSSGKGTLPELNIRGEVIPENSYRISITMRRVNDIQEGIPSMPEKFDSANTTQTEVSTQETPRKLNIVPKRSADKKAIAKSSVSNKFIGFAEGIPGSSTDDYSRQAGDLANTGDYKKGDVVFVSIPGKRVKGTTNANVKSQQDRTIKESIKAVEAGAKIITDNEKYIHYNSRTKEQRPVGITVKEFERESGLYNLGEKRLYENMKAKGYEYSEITVMGEKLGSWSKASAQENDVSLQQDMIQGENGESEQIGMTVEEFKKKYPEKYAAKMKKLGIKRNCKGN